MNGSKGVKIGVKSTHEALKTVSFLAELKTAPSWLKAIGTSQTVKFAKGTLGSLPLVGIAIGLILDWSAEQYKHKLISAAETVINKRKQLSGKWARFDDALAKAVEPEKNYTRSMTHYKGETISVPVEAQALAELSSCYRAFYQEALKYEEALGVLMQAYEIAKEDHEFWDKVVHSLNNGTYRKHYDNLVSELSGR